MNTLGIKSGCCDCDKRESCEDAHKFEPVEIKTELEYDYPEFPENKVGIERGGGLIALKDLKEHGMPVEKGDVLPMGWNGEHIICGPFTWAVDQIENEVENFGVWKVASRKELGEHGFDFLKDEEKFITQIEGRNPVKL